METMTKVGLWILGISILSIILSCSVADEEYQGDVTEEACAIAQQYILNQLISPSSAEFNPCFYATVNVKTANVYEVHTYVDAENAFGAMMRVSYVVEVRDNQNGYWSLLDLYII